MCLGYVYFDRHAYWMAFSFLYVGLQRGGIVYEAQPVRLGDIIGLLYDG